MTALGTAFDFQNDERIEELLFLLSSEGFSAINIVQAPSCKIINSGDEHKGKGYLGQLIENINITPDSTPLEICQNNSNRIQSELKLIPKISELISQNALEIKGLIYNEKENFSEI